MSDIKRYDLDQDEDSDGNLYVTGMFEASDGEYVKFVDHESECAALRAEVERLQKSEAEWKFWRGTAVKACDRAESRLAAATELLRKCKDALFTDVYERSLYADVFTFLTSPHATLPAGAGTDRFDDAWTDRNEIEEPAFLAAQPAAPEKPNV